PGNSRGTEMSKISNIVMAGMLAFATAVPAIAEAAPMMGAPVKVEKSTDVTNVCCWNCRGYWRGRYWAPRRYWGPRVYVGPRYWGPRSSWGPRVVIGPTIVVRPRRAYWAWCGPRWNRYRCLVRY